MARRKRKAAPRRSYRRGVGSPFTDFVTVVGGAIAGGILARKISSQFAAGMNPNIVAAAQIVGGAYIGNQAKHPFVKGAGIGVAVEGGTLFAKKMGVVGDADPYGDEMGYLDEISGTTDYTGLEAVSGDDDELYS